MIDFDRLSQGQSDALSRAGTAHDFFPRDEKGRSLGLDAQFLAQVVVLDGPLAIGRDDILWASQGGVWRPARNVVRDRVAFHLGKSFRPHYVAGIEGLIRGAANLPQINADPVPEIVNFRNGLYYWPIDMLAPHSSGVLTTVQLPIEWNPSAKCPAFDRFLSEVLPADMVPVVWELVAYLMYAGNPLHKAIMLVGGGRNGKGTFLRVMNALLGVYNVTSVSLHSLVTNRFAAASLFGKIANIAGDIDASYLESTATFKAITGGDQIHAEHKGRDAFDFTPWAVPVFSANRVPPSSDVTVGYLSRWLVVEFPNDFSGREDRTLTERLTTAAELEGIAAKALDVLPKLLDRGDFELPESGRRTREEFARKVDQVRMWLVDCADVDPAYDFIERTAAYAAYRAWASRDGYRPVRAAEFYARLEALPGITATRRGSGGTRGFTGIKITDTAEAAGPGAAEILMRGSRNAD